MAPEGLSEQIGSLNGSGRGPRVWWRELQRQTVDSVPVSSLSNLLCDFGQITSLLWASASSFIKWVC